MEENLEGRSAVCTSSRVLLHTLSVSFVTHTSALVNTVKSLPGWEYTRGALPLTSFRSCPFFLFLKANLVETTVCSQPQHASFTPEVLLPGSQTTSFPLGTAAVAFYFSLFLGPALPKFPLPLTTLCQPLLERPWLPAKHYCSLGFHPHYFALSFTLSDN